MRRGGGRCCCRHRGTRRGCGTWVHAANARAADGRPQSTSPSRCTPAGECATPSSAQTAAWCDACLSPMCTGQIETLQACDWRWRGSAAHNVGICRFWQEDVRHGKGTWKILPLLKSFASGHHENGDWECAGAGGWADSGGARAGSAAVRPGLRDLLHHQHEH